MSFDFRYPTPLPSTKGWGPGWPDCQPVAREGVSIFFPGVHKRIAPLVDLIVDEMRDRGFVFLVPGCWGYGCRATKDEDGEPSPDDIPSFHSWGLGFDINAPLNVFGSDASRAQLAQPENRWVIELWREYGFFWLGPDIKDWMHFSFVGSPADADAMLEKARRELMGLTPEQAEKLNKAFNFIEGVDEILDPDEPINARALGERVGRGVKKAEDATAPAPVEGLKRGDTVKLT